ncbi:MAG: hypothetical protein V4577_17485, partial [Bacteroidota bacterium]
MINIDMLFPQFSDNPFQIDLCFHKIIERLEDIAAKNAGADSEKAKQLLEEIKPFPELRAGIKSISQ